MRDFEGPFDPYWLEIFDLSLALGDMESLKSAVILPLIMELNSRVDTDHDNFKNHRPVTNLLFVSKLIELWLFQSFKTGRARLFLQKSQTRHPSKHLF